MSKIVSFQHLGKVGRLGNTLFQLASTVGLAADHGAEPRFNADWLHRPYFSVPDEFFAPIDDSSEVIDPTDLVPHIDARARVYLQDHHLFADYMPTIKQFLAPSATAKEILTEHSEAFNQLKQPVLSVHVRRGDNVPGQDAGVPDKWHYYPLPPLSYYLAALEELRKGKQWAHVAVFSDEPAWCRENFPTADYVHYGVVRPKEHEPGYFDVATHPVLDWVDIHLMSRCEGGHVLSNSTFSVWGALLAGDKTAIVPSPWYGPLLSYVDASLLWPASWRRLPFTPTFRG